MIPLKDTNPTTRTPWVTLALIAANLAVYLFVQPTIGFFHGAPDAGDRETKEAVFFYEWALVPCEVVTAESVSPSEVNAGTCEREDPDPPAFPEKSVWLSILTTTFLHGSLLHVLGNMLFLWIFGNNVEDVLGPVRYVLFYVAGALAAAAAQIVSDPSSTVPVVGASGAIAAVMGGYLLRFPGARVWTFLFVVVLPLPAVVVLVAWFLLQFLTPTGSGVAWIAHVAGFVAGMLLMTVLAPRRETTPSVKPGF